MSAFTFASERWQKAFVTESLHHPSSVPAHAAIVPMCEAEVERREADEHIDEILKCRPLAEDHVDDVPGVYIVAHERAETHEAPVEAADDDENKLNSVKCFHAFIRFE